LEKKSSETVTKLLAANDVNDLPKKFRKFGPCTQFLIIIALQFFVLNNVSFFAFLGLKFKADLENGWQGDASSSLFFF